jgi:hypothetical protein
VKVCHEAKSASNLCLLEARQAGHLCRRSDSRKKYKARKNASVEEIGGLMESSAPVTCISVGKADDVCDALLYIVRHGRVSRFLDLFQSTKLERRRKSSHMEV